MHSVPSKGRYSRAILVKMFGPDAHEIPQETKEKPRADHGSSSFQTPKDPAQKMLEEIMVVLVSHGTIVVCYYCLGIGNSANPYS